jgi:hypothetical protein
MKPATVEVWIWTLIYGGLLFACLGLFAGRQDASLGWLLGCSGVGLVAAGVLLIYLRSRMRE